MSTGKHRGIFTCGHEGVITVSSYNVTSRNEKAEYIFKNNMCKDCETKKNIKVDKDKGLPELKGSDKQISWAIKLRSEWINSKKKDKQNLIKKFEAEYTEEQRRGIYPLSKDRAQQIVTQIEAAPLNSTEFWGVVYCEEILGEVVSAKDWIEVVNNGSTEPLTKALKKIMEDRLAVAE